MTTPATAPAKVDVSALIDHSKVKAVHAAAFLLCAACTIMDGFDVQALGFVAPAVIQDWKIAPALLGPVFGASNLGVLVGQLTFTILADRVGRRPVLILGVLLFSVLTILTGRANTITELLVIRFIAGTALGSIIPNATALVGEYSPLRLRIKLTTYIGIGFTAGAMLGGFVAAAMIPAFGWRSVFYFGGAVPLVLAVMMYFWLPESLQLLVLRRRSPEQIGRWLNKLAPDVPLAPGVQYRVNEESRKGVPFVRLFREGRGISTILLWVINFMNLLNLYSLANWLPTVVRGAGYPTSTAVLVGTMLQVGGTFSPFLFASLIMRFGPVPVLTTVFSIACVTIAIIGHPGLSLTLLVVFVIVAGACIVGGQPSVNALSATYYPTYLRSTGLGWSLGIGRAGAIVGPVLAGEFMALKWTTQSIFLALAVPAFFSAVAMFALRWVMKSQASKPAAGSAP
ncbi:MAG: MFS transporter [Terriglobales bacterium]